MGTMLWATLSRKGVIAMSLAGLLVPGSLGRAFRQRQEQLDQEADNAFSRQLKEFKTRNAFAENDAEAWKRDLAAINGDVKVSFLQMKDRIGG